MSRYTEDLVIKSYAMLHEENPSTDTKVIRPKMEVVEVSYNDKKQITEVFDRILIVYGLIGEAKIAKRLLTRTHLISVVSAIWKSIESELSDKQVAE